MCNLLLRSPDSHDTCESSRLRQDQGMHAQEVPFRTRTSDSCSCLDRAGLPVTGLSKASLSTGTSFASSAYSEAKHRIPLYGHLPLAWNTNGTVIATKIPLIWTADTPVSLELFPVLSVLCTLIGQQEHLPSTEQTVDIHSLCPYILDVVLALGGHNGLDPAPLLSWGVCVKEIRKDDVREETVKLPREETRGRG